MKRGLCTHKGSRLREPLSSKQRPFVTEKERTRRVKPGAQRRQAGAKESHCQGGRLGLIKEAATGAQVYFICSWSSELVWTIDGYRRRQWHPTPVLLPGKSHGGGAW